MTDDEIKALEARAKTAARFPWCAHQIAMTFRVVSKTCADVTCPSPEDCGTHAAMSDCCGPDYNSDDSAFIAASPATVLALIAEIQRLRTALR